MYKSVLLLIISFIAFEGQAQNYIFNGLIGRNDAVLAFDLADDDVSEIEYYLNKDKALVHLVGNVVDSNEFVFYHLDPNYEDTMATMFLKLRDGYYLEGIFQGNDGLQQEIHLSWLDITRITHNFSKNELIDDLKIEVPFRYVYTSDMQFNVPKDSLTINKYDRVYIVRNLPSEIPSISFKAASSNDKKIIQFCDSVAINHVIAQIDCELEYEVDISIKRFDAKVLSVLYKVKWNCGGSDADFYYQGFTFDRNSGNLIGLEDLFALADENTMDDDVNKVAVKANEAKIRSLVSKTIVNGGNSLCDYDNYPLFGFKNYYLTTTKLCLLPSFDKVLATCRGVEKSTVAISEIAGQIKPQLLEVIK